MKKKICLKQRYWGYCFKCNKENKLQKLMLRSYPISQNDIVDEHWALNTKKN